MGWVKLDDQFSRHPKVLQVGPLSGWLHVCALNYCAQYMTDGFVPKAAVNGLADFAHGDLEKLGRTVVALDFVPALVESGMWSEVKGGYQIHDYLDYNPSRDEIMRKRQADLDRKRNPEHVAADSERNRNGSAEESKRPVPVPHPVPLENVPTPIGVSSAEPDKPDPVDEERLIFEYYRTRVQPKARQFPRKKIASRLKRFSSAELRSGIDHFAADPWWMDNNAGRGAEWFFDSDARAEQFLLLAPRRKVVDIRSGRVDQADLDELSPGETA